ncbi:hypothetical protein SLA2020_333910 [Shorea laevis]
MKVVSWNCQGLGSALTVRNLRDLCFKYQPDLVFLCETKQQTPLLEKHRRKLGFDHGEYFSPQGRAGGLALWWRKELQVQVSVKNEHLFDGSCLEPNCPIPWHFSFIYGCPVQGERTQFWVDCQNLRRDNGIPWLVMGDLNALLSYADRRGKGPISVSSFSCLEQFMESCELQEIGFKGNPYTWTNSRAGPANVQHRLDRALANSDWFQCYPHAQILHELKIGSDHSPLILCSNAFLKPPRKLFRFELKWTLENGYQECIQNGWQVHITGSEQYKVLGKLKNCRADLISWSKKLRGNPQGEIKLLHEQLDFMQNQEPNDANMMHQKMLIHKLNDLWAKEEAYWFQRSRVNWIKHGDRNSSFFHCTASRRRNRNQIFQLQNDAGQLLQSEEEISTYVFQSLSSQFQACPTTTDTDIVFSFPPVITSEMNNSLCADITLEEVRIATFQLGAFKAPGPDGFPGVFYQKHWDLVGGDVHRAISRFWATGFLLKEFNKTNIILIPKVKNPQTLSQYRPISLCNFVSKIISRIMVNRLQPFLSQIISPEQSAFVPGRMIQDNLVVAHEAFHGFAHRCYSKDAYMALKLNIHKAYDTVDWLFLEQVLRAMGFHDWWVTRVMEFVRSTSYSILVNGKPTKTFFPGRGLRQGDPLSPYLYLLVVDVLSKLVSRAVRDGSLYAYRITRRCPPISHLLFADDALLFCKASINQASFLKELLSLYGAMSGQRINFSKSAILFSRNTSLSLKTNICSLFSIHRDAPVHKYLGLPTSWGRSKKQSLQFVIEKVQQKLQAWKKSLLSVAGREVLIKSVAQSIPTYAMYCFKFPKNVCHQLNSLMSNFWWGQRDDKSRIHWVSWGKLSISKNYGGLGFRDVEAFNLSLLAKQCWRLIHNPNSLWVKLLRALYHPSGHFLQAKLGFTPSWIWRSLLKGRDVLKLGLRYIGNGQNVFLWGHKWIPTKQGFQVSTPQPQHGYNVRVCNLLTPTFGWDVQKLNLLLCPEDVKAIVQVPAGPSPDRLIWHFTRNGEFTIRSAYQLARKNGFGLFPLTNFQVSLFPSFLKSIWKLGVPPKIKIFMWKVLTNALPVKANLFHKGIVESPVCGLCGGDDESITHMLFTCQYAARTWFASRLAFRPTISSISEMVNWWSFVSSQWDKHIPNIMEETACLFWYIWKNRNLGIFQGRTMQPQMVVQKAMFLAVEFCRVNGKDPLIPPVLQRRDGLEDKLQRWSPPPEDVVKCNTDAAVDVNNGVAGLAVVCRNSRGILVDGLAFKQSVSSVLMAETLAVRAAVGWAARNGLKDIIFESDSKELMQVVNKKVHLPWQIEPLVLSVWELCKSFSFCEFNYVRRKANSAADWVAKQCLKNSCPLYWTINPPTMLCNLLRTDVNY